MDIPHAKDLAKASRQTLATHKAELARDVADNSDIRFIELHDEVARLLHHADRNSIEVVVAETPISYPPGSKAVTKLTDFGSSHAAATKLIKKLHAKKYRATLRISKNRLRRPLLKDDALILIISW